jgi:hypothetical protein
VKRQTKLILFAVAGLLAAAAIVEWRWQPLLTRYVQRCLAAVTTELPTCDRVEVFHLDGETDAGPSEFPVRPRPYGRHSEILGTVTLTGSEAGQLASMWRSLRFGKEYRMMCHFPGYGLRFYRGTSLQFETSVCFHCNNFYVTALGDSFWWGFDTQSPEAVRMLNRLRELFPPSVNTKSGQ